jgi:acylglycerol lipase
MTTAVLSRFRAVAGHEIYYEHWIPDHPKAIIVFVHGISEHTGRYGPFIRHFVDRGYGVAVYDQRGHGQSGGKRGHIDHFQDLLGDLAQFIQRTREAYPRIPMFLMGHSFGGQVALNFVVRYSKGLRGIIVSSPNIGLKFPIPFWKRWLVDHGHRVAPYIRVSQRLDPKHLSHDEAITTAYANDPRVLRGLTLQMSAEVIRNLDLMMALASRIHIPALFLHAGDDKICDPEATRRFYRRIPVMRKAMKVYDGMRHEILNEIDRAQVFADIEHWLESMLRDERVQDEDLRPTTYTNMSVPVAKVARGERWEG